MTDWLAACLYENFIEDLIDHETKKENFSSTYEVSNESLTIKIVYMGKELMPLEYTYFISDQESGIEVVAKNLNGEVAFRGKVEQDKDVKSDSTAMKFIDAPKSL